MIRNDIKIRQRFGFDKSALERNQTQKIQKDDVQLESARAIRVAEPHAKSHRLDFNQNYDSWIRLRRF